MMKDLNWKPLQERRRENRLLLLFKILNNLVAIPPDKHLSFKNKKYNLRSNHSKEINLKTSEVDSHKNSFFPKTILDWNDLTENQISCQSVIQFKAALQRTI